MKFSAFLSCGSVAAIAALLVSCAHDVPVPEDPEAHVWSPKIKNSYSSWQPPRQMPKGNAEYEAAFSRAGVTTQHDALDLDMKPVVTPDSAVAAEETVRLDIVGKAPESCKVNGELLADDMTDAFLKDFVHANAKSKVVICYADSFAKQAEAYQKRCKEIGFSSIEMKKIAAPAKTVAKKTAKKPAKRAPKVVIDRSVPGSTYTVVKGDSLSRIAKKKYKNGNLWQIIYRENQAVLKSKANRLVPGMKLVSPAVKQAK